MGIARLLVIAGVSVVTSAAVGWRAADHARATVITASKSWHGRVGTIVRSGVDRSTAKLSIATVVSGFSGLTTSTSVSFSIAAPPTVPS